MHQEPAMSPSVPAHPHSVFHLHLPSVFVCFVLFCFVDVFGLIISSLGQKLCLGLPLQQSTISLPGKWAALQLHPAASTAASTVGQGLLLFLKEAFLSADTNPLGLGV